MSLLRRVVFVLGLLILLASIALLIWANLPNERIRERQPIPVEDLTLPTPVAFGPDGVTAIPLTSSGRGLTGELSLT